MAEVGVDVYRWAGPGTAGVGIPEGGHGAGLERFAAEEPNGGWKTIALLSPLCLS